MIKLTQRQQEIFSLIARTIEKTGFPPTRAEIANELGFRSANAAEEHLQALARKGVIEIVPGISRGIRLLGQNAATVAKSQVRTRCITAPLKTPIQGDSVRSQRDVVEKTYQLDPALFDEKPDYLIKVRDPSLRDIGIFEGDLVAVKKTARAQSGQIVVARRPDGELIVRRYSKTDAAALLVSENADFSPIRLEAGAGSYRVDGVVIGLVRTSF